MATSILYLHRDFGLTVHHGNFILTGGLPPAQAPLAFNWGGCRPPDPPAFPGGEGCRPPPRPPHPRIMRGFAPQTPHRIPRIPKYRTPSGTEPTDRKQP